MNKYIESNTEIWIKVEVPGKRFMREWIEAYHVSRQYPTEYYLKWEFVTGRSFQLIYFDSPMQAYEFGIFSGKYLSESLRYVVKKEIRGKVKYLMGTHQWSVNIKTAIKLTFSEAQYLAAINEAEIVVF